MKCANCGKEVTGKFCSECGMPLGYLSARPSTVTINGETVDLRALVEAHGKNRVAAIKELRTLTGLGLKEAKDVIDSAYERFAPNEEPSGGFWAGARENAKQQAEAKKQEKQEEKARLKQMDKEGVAYCPRCHSTNLTANKKGFGFGKAVVGTILAGPLGAAAGGIGSGKVRLTCLKCGHQFKPGQKW